MARELNLQLLKTRMAFRQAVQRLLRKYEIGMTFEMLQILYQLRTLQGVSQQQLAEATARDKACITSLINNLEKKGWVQRKQSPDDRRARQIFLTKVSACRNKPNRCSRRYTTVSERQRPPGRCRSAGNNWEN